MRILRLTLVLATFLSPKAGAQQLVCSGPIAVVARDSLTFSLDSIPDWRFDCYAGKADGFALVVHHPADDPRRGWGLMYATILAAPAHADASLGDRIAEDIADRRRGAPELTVSTRGNMPTRGGGTATVRQFIDRRRDLYEVIAYVPSGASVVVLGLRATTQGAIDNSFRDFERLVRSYTQLATRPRS